ncbi:MAG: T9SS type A sorting domain-containing protein [Ignavibacteriaceae bacterium]|nr:T9SS type A sorting domain-containing protein [Ignavibacteriaceae bacterium]
MVTKILFLKLLFLISIYGQYQSVWDQVPEDIREKNSFKRYEWFYRPRTDENGKFPKEHVEQQIAIEEQKVIENNLRLEKVDDTSDLWTNIGPIGIDMTSSFIPYWGKVSGRVRGLDVHPTDPNIVYAGAAAGGIWKTTNGGTTWTDKSSSLTRLTFGAIAIDPNNTNTIYAGTGETIWFYNTTTYEGNGLYKSTDGGDNWTQITNGFGIQTQFSDIEVNPGNSNVLLASLGSGNWNLSVPTNQGIWRSSDAGATWTRTLNVQNAFDVAFHPSNSLLAYAASGNKVSAGGFYRSTDGGATWIQSNTGLPAATSIGRMQFELSPSSPLIIYALIYSNVALPGGRATAAFRSTDGGVNWSQISSGVLISGTYDGGTTISDQGSYDLCLSVHPTNPDIVCFGNVELSRTTNGSSISFVRNPSGYIIPGYSIGAWACWSHVDIHKIHFAQSNGNIVYMGCDGGVYKSTDAGLTWFNVNNNINTIQFYRVASHPTNSSILFGGAQDNGNFSTADKGATDWVFELSGDGMECFVDYSNPNYVFMSTQYGSLYRSTDGGSSWSNMVGSGSNTAWTAPYWQHPTNSNYIYAGWAYRIIRSTDKGNSWFYFSASNLTSNRITSVAQSKVTVANMMSISSYFTTTPDIDRSTDEGATWTDITTNYTTFLSTAGLSGTNIQRVVADPVSGTTFYITRASYGGGQVLKTTNFGTNWTNITGNLPLVPVNDLFIDPANINHLYAGNDLGVYWTTNGGTSWVKLSNGMPFVPVLDFDFYSNAGTRYLRAATHGRGVYELNIDSPLPVELSLFTAKVLRNKGIKLDWRTETEVSNFGFEIERSQKSNFNSQTEWKKIGFIDGHGNSNSPKEYSYLDEWINYGSFYYRLKQIDTDGQFEYSKIIEVDAGSIPNGFVLEQNYPNPFNPITTIKFAVAETQKAELKVFDLLGNEVATLFNGIADGGKIYEAVFDAENYSSGIYFYRLETENKVENRKMLLLK